MFDDAAPLKVYGLKVSYFTGKLEAYLRYKRIPYDFVPMTAHDFTHKGRLKTGAMQMPMVELPDGRWITDTTPIIEWLESQYCESSILPDEPLCAFVARLIEDYADEWLWRPAMVYRWIHDQDARLLSHQISSVMGRNISVPAALKRWNVRRRQHKNFVLRDGFTEATAEHIKNTYIRLLDNLEGPLSTRDFVMGDRLTLADIGLMGPLFRHFAMDPTPAEIMRERAPNVMAWVYRVWAARSAKGVTLPRRVPDDLAPLLREIGETHLVALNANARAWISGHKTYTVEVQGVAYKSLQTSVYRAWCLERLQAEYEELGVEAKAMLDQLVGTHGLVPELLKVEGLETGYDPEGFAPFLSRAAPVFPVVKE